MHCPNCGSPDIRLRHVGKKTGGVIGATAGGLAVLKEPLPVRRLVLLLSPWVGTLAGGPLAFYPVPVLAQWQGPLPVKSWTGRYLMNILYALRTYPQ